jgi:hypothetical protein
MCLWSTRSWRSPVESRESELSAGRPAAAAQPFGVTVTCTVVDPSAFDTSR